MTMLDDRLSANGHEPADLSDLPDNPPIPFGPKDHQTVQPCVASMMLTRLREIDHRTFGELLHYAMTGEVLDLHTNARGRRAR